VIFGRALLALLGIVHAVGAYFYFSKERHASLWAAAWLCLTPGAGVRRCERGFD